MNQTQKEKLFDLERSMRDNAVGIITSFRQALEIDTDSAFKMLSGVSDYINEPLLQKAVFRENENRY